MRPAISRPTIYGMKKDCRRPSLTQKTEEKRLKGNNNYFQETNGRDWHHGDNTTSTTTHSWLTYFTILSKQRKDDRQPNILHQVETRQNSDTTDFSLPTTRGSTFFSSKRRSPQSVRVRVRVRVGRSASTTYCIFLSIPGISPAAITPSENPSKEQVYLGYLGAKLKTCPTGQNEWHWPAFRRCLSIYGWIGAWSFRNTERWKSDQPVCYLLTSVVFVFFSQWMLHTLEAGKTTVRSSEWAHLPPKRSMQKKTFSHDAVLNYDVLLLLTATSNNFHQKRRKNKNTAYKTQDFPTHSNTYYTVSTRQHPISHVLRHAGLLFIAAVRQVQDRSHWGGRTA